MRCASTVDCPTRSGDAEVHGPGNSSFVSMEQVRAQQMENEASRERRGGLFLLGTRGDLRWHRCRGPADALRRWRAREPTHRRRARRGDGLWRGPVDRGERGVGVDGQHADQAGNGGVGGHRTEDLRVSPQLADVGEAVPTDRQCRREIGHDLAGIVSGQRFSIRCELGPRLGRSAPR